MKYKKNRTRIKICGFTRRQDVNVAITAGVDAIGLVFYPKSPRHISVISATSLIANLPPFVQAVGLFVNQPLTEIKDICAQLALSLLQFHGDETPIECAEIAHALQRPFLRACRISPNTSCAEILKYELSYRTASPYFSGLLLDAHVENFGGAGQSFNWSVIPKTLGPRIILSGGLCLDNINPAITTVRPYAVDISSGVETSKGIKDADKIHEFTAAVRQSDQFFTA